jgi:hypothetical protein
MREWNLKAGDPISLTLAADIRLGPTDYCNDQIWELSLGGGEPPALAFQTVYGLRALNMRLFPRFTEGDITLVDPTTFHAPPVIHSFYPNFISLTLSPFPDIDVTAEYWVPGSQVVTGRLHITNRGSVTRQLNLEWASLLTPTAGGQRMAPFEMGASTVLAGQTSDLAPVLFMTGGPEVGKGPYPSLTKNLDLQPVSSRQLVWVLASLTDQEASYTCAQHAAASNWDAEKAHIDLLNSSEIDIYTGDMDWDIAFAMSQKVAFGLLSGPTQHLPNPSFVLSRQPDQGYSPRGDGSDHNHLWNGQTPLESYYLIDMLLPVAPEITKGIIYNYLTTQTEDGSIDWKPGLGGQRSQLCATPLLASLAWRIYQSTEDQFFLEEIYPRLVCFINSWFSTQHDRDSDGIPEWDHPMQTGFDDHPVFAHWHTWSQGIDIHTAESPDLCAFLYRECQSLVQMGKLLGHLESEALIGTYLDKIKSAVEDSWDETMASYHYWDRDSHQISRGVMIGEHQGPGNLIIESHYPQPVRIQISLQVANEKIPHPRIFIHGITPSGQHLIEQVSFEKFHWYFGLGRATGERIYTDLEHVVIEGIGDEDLVTLQTATYEQLDQTNLLPLWANIPDQERAQNLVKKTIMNPDLFWRPYGVRACAHSIEVNEEFNTSQSVHLPFNVLIGEGLLLYNYRSEAAELFTRIMNAIIKTLKRDGAFRRHYHAESGYGIGEKNALEGLAPIGFFLDTLGVRIISPIKVAIVGFNPFPWPVTVKYRGLTVLRQKDKTNIIFPGGQTVTVTDPDPQVIVLA